MTSVACALGLAAGCAQAPGHVSAWENASEKQSQPDGGHRARRGQSGTYTVRSGDGGRSRGLLMVLDAGVGESLEDSFGGGTLDTGWGRGDGIGYFDGPLIRNGWRVGLDHERVDGPLLNESARMVLVLRQDQVLACHEQSNPRSAGRIRLRFDVDRLGFVGHVEAEAASEASAFQTLVPCVSSRVQAWRFPVRDDSSPATVDATYSIEPARERARGRGQPARR